MSHDGAILGALVMPDGPLLSWSTDNTLRQWDANWPPCSIFTIARTLMPDKEMDVLDRYHLERSDPICRSPGDIPVT